MHVPLFVYGTLQDPAVQVAVIGRRATGSPDRLPGYRKERVVLGGRAYPRAIPAPGHSVAGRLIHVRQAELRRVDGYEGTDYRRVWVRLASGREAWVYCAP